MKRIFLGHTGKSKKIVSFPVSAFRTHLHLLGGTGKGKTTAIQTLLQPLMLDPYEQSCVVIWDRLGGLADDLLLWMSSPFCTQAVRDRLVYIEPANEDYVIGLNPLLHDTPAHGYYKVARATDIVLRAWESSNIEAMPRLARWVFNCFWAAAQLGLTIADCNHFLLPGSPYHSALLELLPPRLRMEWSELLGSRSAQVLQTLDSSRNRLKPFFESDILRRMFGVTENRLDVLKFMREGKIVILNLAPRNRLSPQLADAIGALVLNEILATARSLPRGVRYPTYLVLDEFQNFVGPDIESAIPEVRQLGLRLLLSHQSMSQLERGDHDLTSLIFQAQSRMIFGLQGEDAEIIARELAGLTFDPDKIKNEIYSRRQLISGHRTVELSSWSDSDARAEQWSRDYGSNWSQGKKSSRRLGDPVQDTAIGDNTVSGGSNREGKGGSASQSKTRGKSESLLPEYEQFLELSSKTYSSFEEQRAIWEKKVRKLKTGRALLQLVNDARIQNVHVKRSLPHYTGWDLEKILRFYPQGLEAMDALIEQNYQSGLFSDPRVIDQQIEARLQAAIQPRLTVRPDTETDDGFA